VLEALTGLRLEELAKRVPAIKKADGDGSSENAR
jgi:hypothetical protein